MYGGFIMNKRQLNIFEEEMKRKRNEEKMKRVHALSKREREELEEFGKELARRARAKYRKR